MDLLELGIAAARAGNRVEARMYLEVVTLQEPDNAQAFLWLSFVLDDARLATRCLERVIELDPSNEQAKRGLAWIRSNKSSQGVPLPQRLSDAELSTLLRALGHADPRAVAGAARRLGEAADSRAVEPLLKALLTVKDKTAQSQVRAALIAIGTPSVDPALKRLMVASNPDISLQLGAVLARVRSMGALAACREVIERAKFPAARYAMAVNLTASIHGEAGLSLLYDYVTDRHQDERARMTIVITLGQAIKSKALDAARGLGFLMELAADQYIPIAIRQAALVALGVSNHASIVRTVYQTTGDKEAQLRIAAVDALARFTPPQTSLLKQLAGSPDPAVRARATHLLAGIASAYKH